MNHPTATRYVYTVAFTLLAILAAAPTVQAQNMRPVETFFVRPQVGIASYVGDRDKSFLSFNPFPYSAGLELGYQFSQPFSLGLGYQLGHYPGISGTDDAALRHSLDLLLRYTFGGRTGVAPYVHIGGHATFGEADVFGTNDSEQRTAFGPLAGIGLDVPVSNRVSWFLEGTTRAAFPDDAADGREGDRFGSFDLLTTFGTGLKINFKSAAVAPRVLSVDGPAQLRVGQVGTFRANVAEDATRPVEYRWEWGDGETSTGLSATHSYDRPGTFTVRFTASNRSGTSAQTHTVTVVRPVEPPQITSISADPNSPDTEAPVRFSAVVRGDGPLSYQWTFGDGSSATTESPTHTFGTPGTYTVSLRVSNEAGSDTETMQLRVRPYEAAACRDLDELNSVYFPRNSSVLSAEGRRSAQENVEVLLECPNLSVRIEGWAAPGERNPRPLSTDRAQAVRQFYTTNGVPAERITIVGMGQPGGTTSKKEGGQQYQRADSIPVR